MAAGGSGRGNPFESPGSSKAGSGHSNVGTLGSTGANQKRDKRSVAVYLKGESTKGNNSKPLNDFLDNICEPQKAIDDLEAIDWCKWIISGGLTFEEFSKKVSDYDSSVMCGLVWTAHFVAYRCRTCGISPCMSICSDCFQAGNHEGHDYNMFRSQAGGACDCGDSSVMKPEGFCPRHGENHDNKAAATPPAELMAVPKEMMPRLFLRLLFYLRSQFIAHTRMVKNHYRHYMPSISDLEPYLNFLQSLSDMGAAMRRIMTQALTDEASYKKAVEPPLEGEQLGDYASFLERRNSLFETPPNFEKYKDRPGLSQKLEYTTIIEELLYWVVHFEFPQRLVTFLLGLLPDDLYKDAFSKAFVKHYSRISMVLMSAKERTTVANRIVHISVQLFSNEHLAVQLTENYSLLLAIILSLSNMIQSIRVGSCLEGMDVKSNFHCVVNCEHGIMKDHCYWPVVSDLINVLSHRKIAHRFLQDPDLIVLWLDLLTDMQGMNLNVRELTQHVEFEPETYYAAFSAELEISASPMWSLLMHCQTQDTCHYVLEMIKATIVALQDWFEAINFKDSMKPVSTQLTFHLPLHRYLSMFTMTAVNVHGVDVASVLPDESTLKKIMMHVLQIQVCLTQIYAGMWVRNGVQIKGQAMTYIQCHFCYSMADADLYLLQLCAAGLDPDYFVETTLDRYQIMKWLSYSPESSNTGSSMDADHELAMVEGALSFFCALLGMHTYLGVSETDLMRKEMSSLLCMNDRQHSALMDLMPEKTGVGGLAKELFEPTLKELSEYKAPNFEAGGLQQGTYVPKAAVWENDFDPVHVSQRAIYRRDMQSAMDRYCDFLRVNKKYKKKTAPWPPFLIKEGINPAYRGIYRLLNCKVLHAFLFTVLHKAVAFEKSVPENILCYTMHLLAMCLHFAPSSPSTRRSAANLSVHDSELSTWYTTADIRANACDTINEVIVSLPTTEEEIQASFSSVDTDVEMSSLEEMFQIQPSTMISSAGPVTSAQMGKIPALAIVSVPSVSDGETADSTDNLGQARSSVKSFESRGVSTGRFSSKKINIKESLISVLIKLHTKLSGTACYKPSPVTSVTTVGDGAAYVGSFLDNLYAASSSASRVIDEACRSLSMSKVRAGPSHTEKDSKRRKAWNRQQKLMAEFASKQKTFMEQAMDEDSKMAEGDEIQCDQQEECKVTAKEYDCVICSQTTPSSGDRPVGLIVFLQASSVLSHRHRKDQEHSLSLSESQIQRYRKSSCGKVYKQKFEILQKHFEEKSCELSVSIGWEGGVVAQTCGHYLHLDCHRSYMDSLPTQSQAEVLAVNKREYWCPLCRQLSNAVIPIVPEESLTTQGKAGAKDPKQMLKDIADMLSKPRLGMSLSSQTQAMSTVMEDLTNITYPSYRAFSSSPNTESVLLFISSLTRINLEVELLQRGGNLVSAPTSSAIKKHCFLPLFQVLSLHSKVLVSSSTYIDLLSNITGKKCGGESDSVSVSERQVPLLLKDPLSLLVQFVLTLSHAMEPEHLDFLIQMLYNMVYVQALVYLSLKFSSEERDAWRRKGRQSQVFTMEGLLSLVINWLSRTTLYEEDSSSCKLPAICQSVWSPQSVEQTVQEFCLPFLRVCSLLKQHLFDTTIPTLEGQSEFLLLASYLNLWQPGTRVDETSSSTSCVQWVVDEPHTLVRGWCNHIADLINSHVQDSKTVLLINPSWQRPSLIKLPKRYYQIFQMFRSARCGECHGTPKDPAICLVCGQFVCFRGSCCSQNSVYESVAHSIDCGAGTGMFLLVNSSIVIVVRGPRATPWGSVYLDEHGEEDRDLKRGKPLFLSMARYSLLETQWLSHSFDHTCKRWIWHRDQL
ncbi:E3 ubiquitin-protein ligase UBR3 isoform X2 [Aplysia californica]|uniref:E3 ubiquitin-protein ligase n=1 Tax=Aplysia californica TaxID=6500 RepID=A0ABM1W5A2_APLCA|nr:E3 ubiquitin-protein ligase UBR3 isoform X2 [Aplysia californica]